MVLAPNEKPRDEEEDDDDDEKDDDAGAAGATLGEREGRDGRAAAGVLSPRTGLASLLSLLLRCRARASGRANVKDMVVCKM